MQVTPIIFLRPEDVESAQRCIHHAAKTFFRPSKTILLPVFLIFKHSRLKLKASRWRILASCLKIKASWWKILASRLKIKASCCKELTLTSSILCVSTFSKQTQHTTANFFSKKTYTTYTNTEYQAFSTPQTYTKPTLNLHLSYTHTGFGCKMGAGWVQDRVQDYGG